MARLESEAKAGYYPTPEYEMKYILKRLKVERETEITLLDPCCGEGLALKQWQDDMTNKGAVPTSYGIEIEKTRASKAKDIIDHVERCSYDEMRMSHDSISSMYLNPPFMKMNGERMELTFLRDLTTNYLQAGGIFIFNIPQHVLKDVARLIASRFINIKVYRFSDKNFDMYKQVIVYGVRRKKGLRSEEERAYKRYIEKKLLDYAFAEKDQLPTLDMKDWNENYYVVPKNEKEVALFESMRVEREDIIKSLHSNTNDFYEKINKEIKDYSHHVSEGMKVAMPLKITHIATAIASGKLPEDMGDHLLVGVSKTVTEQKEQLNTKSGKMEEVTTISPKSVVRVFSQEGIFDLE